MPPKYGGTPEKCVICTKTVYAMEAITYDKATYHKTCFKCLNCKKTLQPSSVAMIKGDLYCKNCFVRLFKEKGNYLVFGDKTLPKGVAGAAAASKSSADGPNPNVVRPSVAERVDKMAPADFAAAQKRAQVLDEEKAQASPEAPADAEPAPEPVAEPAAEPAAELVADLPAAEPAEQPSELESNVQSDPPIEAASEQVEVAE